MIHETNRSNEALQEENRIALHELIGELQDEVVHLETDREYLTDFLRRKKLVVEFLAWHRTTTQHADGTNPDATRFGDLDKK